MERPLAILAVAGQRIAGEGRAIQFAAFAAAFRPVFDCRDAR